MKAYLKEIAIIVGLDKNLTWQVDCHTFATTAALGNGTKIENVSAIYSGKILPKTQSQWKITCNFPL